MYSKMSGINYTQPVGLLGLPHGSSSSKKMIWNPAETAIPQAAKRTAFAPRISQLPQVSTHDGLDTP